MDEIVCMLSRIIDAAVWCLAAMLGVALAAGTVAYCGERLRRFARFGLVLCGLAVCVTLFSVKPPAGDTDGVNLVQSPFDAYAVSSACFFAFINAGDTDGDGILDADEFARGIDPFSDDTDCDGVFDADEIAQGTAPGDIRSRRIRKTPRARPSRPARRRTISTSTTRAST